MGKVNRGKVFEDVVKDCLEKDPDVYVLRLYDPQGGYAGVANPCDFIVHNHRMFMIECKSVHENTISIYSKSKDPKKPHDYGAFTNRQWEGMLRATNTTSGRVMAGALIWWVDRDVTKFIPIQILEQIRNTGAKSIRYDLDIPNSLVIKGIKKRVYFDYDFREFFEKYEKGT